jgi:hypothetical protein
MEKDETTLNFEAERKKEAQKIRDDFYQLVADSSYPDELSIKCASITIDYLIELSSQYNKWDAIYYRDLKKELENL